MDTELIETLETSSHEATIKTSQLHCALIESPNCLFQCETEQELQHHITIKHRSKNHIQCTVCNIAFRNIDDLATHMNLTHKKRDEADLQYSCRRCEEKFETKSELDKHIKDQHKYSKIFFKL